MLLLIAAQSDDNPNVIMVDDSSFKGEPGHFLHIGVKGDPVTSYLVARLPLIHQLIFLVILAVPDTALE